MVFNKLFRYPTLILIIIFFINDAAAEKQLKPIVFFHEKRDAIQLKRLLQSYDYQDAVSRGKDEFQKMTGLKNWVYTNIKYDFASNSRNLRNALEVLQSSENGQPFICTNFSAVFMQSALSMWWTSRYFFLRKSTGEKHAANDLWSNQYDKWVFMDTTWNLHLEKDGIPLSISEARAEWLKNSGEDIVYVFGSGKDRVEYKFSDFPVYRKDSMVWEKLPLDRNWLGYMEQVALVGRNDFFTYRDGDGKYIWDNIYIIRDSYNSGDREWAFRNREAVEENEMFHKLNNALVSIESKYHKSDIEPGEKDINKWNRVLKVKLSSSGKNSYTPYFNGFIVNIDNGIWMESEESFNWMLKPGMNILKVRIVNYFGVLGPVRTVRVNN